MRVLDYTEVADVKVEVAAVIESCGCLWGEEEEEGEEREKSLDAWEDLVVCTRWLGLRRDWRMGITCGRQSPSSRADFLDGGQSSFRPGPRILHLGIAKLSPILHFTCYICLRNICWPIGRTTQSMLDPYRFHLVVDCVLAFDGTAFPFFHQQSRGAGLYQHAPAATSLATALAEGKPSLLDSHRICQIAENACQDGLTLERQTRDVVGGEATCSL